MTWAAFFINLIIAIVVSVVSYLLMPKPKGPPPQATRDLDNPTADAGRPIPVVFGTMTVKGLNILWFGDKSTLKYKVSA